MNLVVSNIAWTNEEEPAIAVRLGELGVKYIEIAPTKKWQDPTAASAEEIAEYKEFWKLHGLQVVAFQSMLFNRPNLKLFESEANRQETLEYLQKFIRLAGDFGAQAMVFGSPKNRQRGDLPFNEAANIARPFFKQLGQAAQANKTTFCLEPNAKQYNCDFITKAQEGVELVKGVNNPGFRLHLDMGCMTLAGDDVYQSIISAAPWLSHFHVSSPMLEQVEARPDVKHAEAAEALREIGYSKFVSIEMRPAEIGQNLSRVERAVRFAQNVYGPA